MFYKSGIDITNDKQMFNFLKNHFEYPTMNSWNRCYSVANNVKVYNLGLTGDCWTALKLLENGEYDNINWMIQDWQREHPTYEVYFNGRSGGYLVLKDKNYNGHVLPDLIVDSDTYEDYKECCRENFGSVKVNRDELVYYTKLVQDFDRLCDELRAYCDELSNLSFEITEMQKAVDDFNTRYEDDLDFLDCAPLVCNADGTVDVSGIMVMASLLEAFIRVADRSNSGYVIRNEDVIQYVKW